ncbi:MAG: aminotransferase class I/II-fold pyridoxal phosphate-dependent enzyme, partial [Thermodesulfobacteriota bacterium]
MRVPEFRLERYMALYEFSARRLLCCSDCETMSVRELLSLEEGAAEAFGDLRLGYTESPGGLRLREEIARLYRNIGPEDVLVHTGAEEAVFLFMNAVLEPGDHVVVQWPCYQSLFEVARSLGGRVTMWAAREAEGWRPDLADLEKALRPDTKLLVINSPHNPTGALLGPEEVNFIKERAEASGFLVFSDEVYRFLEYDPADRPPPFCDLTERAVSLGVMSKSFGLAGLRLGWLAAGNREVLRAVAGLKDYTTICNPAPSEFLAALALRQRDRSVGR